MAPQSFKQSSEKQKTQQPATAVQITRPRTRLYQGQENRNF